MHLPRSPRRRTAVWAAAAITATAALSGPAPAFAQSAADPNPVTAKVDSAVLDTVAKGKESTFFVVLKSRADLSAAKGKKSHAAKAKSAFASLRSEARNSQKPLQSFLDKEKVGYRSYWIANALEVTGGENLVDALAKRPDVASIVKEHTYKLDRTESKSTDAATDADPTAAEWGVQDIKADQVWDQYDDRGEGIVIANVDSGVQYDHPALVGNYRGNLGNGTFSHDYNWYDPTGQCGTSGVPCDNNGHGTHTMGTMVGAGGVGVAPGAKWIAAKGCESSSCSDSSLLAAGQWILAPTDHNGQNPRPDMAPDIVNNSWGGGDTTFYQDIVQAWNAAGIFEAFASGNDGDGVTCSTGHAPGSQADSYGVGAYDVDGKIASFSGFGPSVLDGSMKPNISAPGVNVRSTWPGSAYKSISGTSMATPHVAGAVALLWAAAPSLIGKIDETRTLLDEGSTDVDDTHCGGTAAMNNVWGSGKLNILASVDAAPHSAGTLSGTAKNQATGKAATATVTAQNADTKRSVTTDATGAYQLHLPAGTYTVTTSGYGFASRTDTVTIAVGRTETLDLALTAVAHHTVSGTVLDVTGKPLKGATVKFTDAPVDAVTTGADGTYAFPSVAEGSFHLAASPSAPVLCNGNWTGALTVDGNETVQASLPPRTDAAGTYSCAPGAYSWIDGRTKVALSGDENAEAVALPFPVKYYGVSYTSAYITTNGLVNFLSPRLGDYANTALPAAAQPNGVVAAFWDDLTLDKKSSVRTTTTGTTGNRRFAIVWNNAALVSDTSVRLTFEAVFDEATGAITLQYKGIGSSALQKGSSATIGIENQAGTDALQYSFNESVLKDASAIRFSPKAA
ncbi:MULTISPECIES: S8 family serine peptidase [unclassified Streptomyces]|uniref:S8 family serine peptidase n=1 Tax=unclassified Streptomyces TaxID=2593676 RepID=UPI0033A4B716